MWKVIKAVFLGDSVELNDHVKNMNYNFNLQIEKKNKLNSKEFKKKNKDENILEVYN